MMISFLIKMLKLDEENSHKGIWKEMANELNATYKELNISDKDNLIV